MAGDAAAPAGWESGDVANAVAPTSAAALTTMAKLRRAPSENRAAVGSDPQEKLTLRGFIT